MYDQHVTATMRELNKERTRVAIVRAALRLFIEAGYEDTTIPMIAKAAGVSPRTVSTYFPAKADIAVGPLDHIFDRLRSRLSQRASHHSALDAVQAWLEEEARIGDETGQNLVRRAMAQNPQLQVRDRERIIDAEKDIAAAVAADLGISAQAPGPRLIAAATLAMTFELWGHKHTRDAEESAPHISEHADLIAPMMTMLREAQRASTPLPDGPEARSDKSD
jgi:AcrR family transcriptional regulator